MEALLPLASSALSLLAQLAPLVSDASMAGKIITELESWLPVVAQFASSLYQPFKNVIAALTSNGVVTDDQIASLKALDAQADADFDAAAAAYQAANPAT